MSTPKSDTSPTEVATPSDPLHQPRRFRWESNYEMNNVFHWALNDTHTDAGSPLGRVTCAEMILLNHWHHNLQNEYFPKLIVELLNKHFQEEFDKANAPGSSKPKVVTRDWMTLERVIRNGSTMCVQADGLIGGFCVHFNTDTSSVHGDTLGMAFINATDAILKKLTDERESLQARINELNKLIP